MTITHVYSYYNGDPETDRRNALARETWGHTYKKGDWIPLPVLDDTLPRLFNEGKRKLPMVRDLINEALDVQGEYICLTNSDTCFAPSMHSRIVNWSLAFKPTLPICCNRKDFGRIDRPLTDDEISKGVQYPGIDLFLFRKDWWLSVVKDFPDMVIGREAWDAVLWVAMRESGGYSIPNLIYHEKHGSTWEQSGNRYTLPGQVHNLTKATAWLTKKGLNPRDFGIRNVPSPWARPLPSTQETPQGGWKVSYAGLYASHPYCFETLLRQIKAALVQSGTAVPKNLKEIIIRQTYGIACS